MVDDPPWQLILHPEFAQDAIEAAAGDRGYMGVNIVSPEDTSSNRVEFATKRLLPLAM